MKNLVFTILAMVFAGCLTSQAQTTKKMQTTTTSAATTMAKKSDPLGYNPVRARLFYYIDSDGDGTITMKELQAVDPYNSKVPQATRNAAQGMTADQIFKKVDADGNGYITRAEFVNANIPVLDKVYGYLVTFVDIVPVQTITMIDEADANSDQMISRAELVAFEKDHGSNDGSRFFDALDIDGNGYLDPVEYDALPQKITVLMSNAYVMPMDDMNN